MPSCHPKKYTERKWKVEEKRRLEFSNATDKNGYAEDDAANFLDDSHGCSCLVSKFLCWSVDLSAEAVIADEK
jgi:hypothetical protein